MKRKILRVPLLAVPVLLIIFLLYYNAFIPSSHFRSMDSDGDNVLSLNEWMAYYGQHMHDWSECTGRDFEPADCDGDLQLSWHEYYKYRFRSDYCIALPYLTITKKPEYSSEIQGYVISEKMRVCEPSPLPENPPALVDMKQYRICSNEN